MTLGIDKEVPVYGHRERMSREELYDLVWSTPVATLSHRFNLSDRGLAKLCARYEIPVPERGWWAKLSAGQPVKRVPLPKASRPYIESVELYVAEDWRSYVSAEDQQWLADRLADEARREPPTLSEEDVSRDRLIVAARRERKPSDPVRPHFALDVSKQTRSRALRLAAALIEECEQRGYKFEIHPSSEIGCVGVVLLGQNIGIMIEEALAKVPHVLTKAEAREKAVGRGWAIPEFDNVPSGQLALLLVHPINGERRSFGEKPDRPLELSFPDFFRALPKIALRMLAEENYRAQRAKEEHEAAERRAEEERVRREEEARRTEERRRRRELLHASTRLRQSRDLQSLIDAVKTATAENRSERMDEWLKYARGVAHALDPVNEIIGPNSPI